MRKVVGFGLGELNGGQTLCEALVPQVGPEVLVETIDGGGRVVGKW